MNKVMVSRQAPRSIVPADTQRSEMELLMDTAVEYSKSDLVPKAYKNRPENILVAFGLADALGIKRGAALNAIHVIEGTPSVSAKAQAALVRAAGHRVRAIQNDSLAAQVQIIRADDPEFPFGSTFTIEDARRAGWLDAWAQRWAKNGNKSYLEKWALPASLGVDATPDELRSAGCPDWVLKAELKHKDNWHNSTEDMLWHRAVTRCVGRACPEVLAGIDLEYFEADEPASPPPPVGPVEVLKPQPKPEPEQDIEDAVIVEDEPVAEPTPVEVAEFEPAEALSEPWDKPAPGAKPGTIVERLSDAGLNEGQVLLRARKLDAQLAVTDFGQLAAEHPDLIDQVLAGAQ